MAEEKGLDEKSIIITTDNQSFGSYIWIEAFFICRLNSRVCRLGVELVERNLEICKSILYLCNTNIE